MYLGTCGIVIFTEIIGFLIRIPSVMPTLKSVCSQSHSQLQSFLSSFPSFIQCVSLSYGKSVFAKTRFSSHLDFLKTCLRKRFIPTGFRLKFSPMNDDHGNFPYHYQRITNHCSRQLMRATIYNLQSKLANLDHEIKRLRQQFDILCIDYTTRKRIWQAVRTFNNPIFTFLKTIKHKKLTKLSQKHFTASNKQPADKLVVTIPDDLHVSQAQRSVLSKGLSFVPLRSSVDPLTTKVDLERFFRRLRLRAHFFHSPPREIVDNPFSTLSRTTSSWTPPPGQFTALDEFIKRCYDDISRLRYRPVRHFNLSKSERAAIFELKSRQDIVIKPADKGGAVVVWDKNLYMQEAARQLSNTTFYEKVSDDLTPTHSALVRDTVQSCISNDELPEEAAVLAIPEAKTSNFYLLPKIHKTNNPGRPIVSACSCPTVQISAFLDSIFTPINQALPTYLKDTTHALNIFGNFSFGSSPSKLLFTMDIQALYTSIPHSDGLKALEFFLCRHKGNGYPIHTLLRLTELVLTLNNFRFAEDHYHQNSGVAMGTKMGPSYACLFIGYLEHQIFQQYRGVLPDLFKRYIDDIGGATSSSREDLQAFLDFIASFHPSIHFTYDISEVQLPLLDIMLTVSGNHIDTSVFYKPTDSHCYLTYSSSHPTKTRDSIPFSQFLRIRRLCSNDGDFIQQLDRMTGFFVQRGYPNHVVQAAKQKVIALPRHTALETNTQKQRDRIPLVLTFHPHNIPVKSVIFKNWNILTRDDDTGPIFKDKPLCAFRRDKNLRDQLVSSKLSTNRLPAGTYPCDRRRCSTCPYICNNNPVHGPTGTHHVFDHITCITKNVIYAIKCSHCGMAYVGQTGQRLGDRFVQHLRSVSRNDGQPVARHFNTVGHNKTHMRLFGLATSLESTSDRLNLETRLIHKLGTLFPNGMNSRHDVRFN